MSAQPERSAPSDVIDPTQDERFAHFHLGVQALWEQAERTVDKVDELG